MYIAIKHGLPGVPLSTDAAYDISYIYFVTCSGCEREAAD
jgi:hypothetical protein